MLCTFFCMGCYLAIPHVDNAKGFIAKPAVYRIFIIRTTFTPNANTIRERSSSSTVLLFNYLSENFVFWGAIFLNLIKIQKLFQQENSQYFKHNHCAEKHASYVRTNPTNHND